MILFFVSLKCKHKGDWNQNQKRSLSKCKWCLILEFFNIQYTDFESHSVGGPIWEKSPRLFCLSPSWVLYKLFRWQHPTHVIKLVQCQLRKWCSICVPWVGRKKKKCQHREGVPCIIRPAPGKWMGHWSVTKGPVRQIGQYARGSVLLKFSKVCWSGGCGQQQLQVISILIFLYSGWHN